MKNLFIYMFVIFFCALSVAYEDQSKEEILNSEYAVVALKINEKLNCHDLYSKISDDQITAKECYKLLSDYYKVIQDEYFLILKSIKGTLKKLSIIAIKFRDKNSGLNLGESYLLFLDKKNGKYITDECSVVSYRRIKNTLEQTNNLEYIYHYIQKNNISECPYLDIIYD